VANKNKKAKKIKTEKKRRKGLGKGLNDLIKSQNKNKFLHISLGSGRYGEVTKCGNCKSVVPPGSKSCLICKTEFLYADKAKCEKCKSVVSVTATKCPKCNALFQ
jgi:RNA polymerase subunit RPABC4/transcription elongation factor Spt4